MKRSYSDLEQHTGDPPFAFGAAPRGPRQPKQYQQQTEPGTGKIKACMQCGTTRTPQWREGPYGPKTLCNACGVKRVRAIKAQQHGKNPGQVPHTAGAGGKKKAAASAAARTVSILQQQMEALLLLWLTCWSFVGRGVSSSASIVSGVPMRNIRTHHTMLMLPLTHVLILFLSAVLPSAVSPSAGVH